VVNQSGGPLASVPPRPVKIGARWRRLDGDGPGTAAGKGDGDDPDPTPRVGANTLVPLPRILPHGTRTPVDVPLEVPAEPGVYELRVALRQVGLGWFGVRVQADVVVAAPAELASRSRAAGSGTG
jgi:hypothetical protein